MSLKFCPKCRSIMMPTRIEGKTILKCPKCGFTEHSAPNMLVDKVSITRKPTETPIVITKTSEEYLPKTRARCPKCGYEEAYYWLQQTRAADEPPTRFYRCVKCGHTWREYE